MTTAVESDEQQYPQVGTCKDCTGGAILPGSPKGKDHENLAGLKCYVSQDGAHPDKAIIIAADAFGLGIANPRIVADTLRDLTGLTVYVPDLIDGHYPPFDKLYKVDTPINKKPFLQRAGILARGLASVVWNFGLTYLVHMRMSVLVPRIKEFARTLKKEKGISHLAVVGFCLGGQVGTICARDVPPEGENPLFEAFVVAHPGPLSVSDFTQVAYPFALICSEEDIYFDRIKEASIAALRKLSVPVEVYEHPGTTHGFAARPDITIPNIAIEYQKALKEAAAWVSKHL
ncbi:hypothetical protein T439DRAFT_323857 [Meredithblackwellia eburnea MCA 4105]